MARAYRLPRMPPKMAGASKPRSRARVKSPVGSPRNRIYGRPWAEISMVEGGSQETGQGQKPLTPDSLTGSSCSCQAFMLLKSFVISFLFGLKLGSFLCCEEAQENSHEGVVDADDDDLAAHAEDLLGLGVADVARDVLLAAGAREGGGDADDEALCALELVEQVHLVARRRLAQDLEVRQRVAHLDQRAPRRVEAAGGGGGRGGAGGHAGAGDQGTEDAGSHFLIGC